MGIALFSALLALAVTMEDQGIVAVEFESTSKDGTEG